MIIKQHHYLDNAWKDYSSPLNSEKCQIVLAFGSPECILNPEIFQNLKSLYPNADIVFSSTSGEILDDTVFDNSVVATAIEFEKTKIRSLQTNVQQLKTSFETGQFLMEQLSEEDLCCLFVIADGTQINGSELVEGLNSKNKYNVPITGGLAGDADRFENTYTGLNDLPAQGNVIAVGFYGKNIRIGSSSYGGWDEFGHERTITRSDKNMLYEIDDKNALDLYKQYLGDYVNELPGSALLFPLSLRLQDSEDRLIRSVLNINEGEKSMMFAGNLPEGSKVRLMKANFDKLIDASSDAATNLKAVNENTEPDLALLISCVGRKLILQDRTCEEVEAVKEIFGNKTIISGFYSYGEISPFDADKPCGLHNQTMTITTFTEF
jgi:hypothetical protein